MTASSLVTIALLLCSPAWSPHAAAQPTTSQDQGGIGVRIVDAPVNARDDPRAKSYIVDHLAPGTVIDRRIEVSNTTDDFATVSLYAAAANITDGSFVGAHGDTQNDLSTWVAVTPTDPTVPAGESTLANVTISVPADAAPGEQYGVIWAEVRSAPSNGAVTQVSRVGIRLYLSVGPGNAPAADFTVDSLTPGRTPDGNPTVTATVHNTGGRALDLNGDLTLSAGPGGLRAGPFATVQGSTLAPGDSGPVAVTLDQQLPAGPWDAETTLRSGLLERTANATITFPESGMADPVPTTSKAALGWLIAGVITIVILAALATLYFARRRRGSAS